MSEFLYKYKPIDKYSLEILINRTIYFPNTNQFNDPFDGQLLPSDFINELKELGYAGPDNEITSHEEIIKNKIDSFGVLSLSRVCDDILMWSHYANAHKGFCLGFKKDLWLQFEEIDWPIDHKPVHYSQEHPFIEIHRDLILKKRFSSDDGFLNLCDMSSALEEAAFTVKHSSWRYENEERIISYCSGHHSFNAEALDHVILGMNISKSDEITIKSLMNRKQWNHVRILKATRGRAALSLEINEA